MRILYVTGLWKGFDDVVLRGQRPVGGLPSFLRPLASLLERGDTVHFLTIEGDTASQELLIGDPRISPSDFVARVPYSGSAITRLFSAIKLKRVARKILHDGAYDFVYLHGPTAGVVADIARAAHVPVGQRLYGTFLLGQIEVWGIFLVSFLRRNEYKSFRDRKAFLIVTNDGSGGDVVHSLIAPSRRGSYNFYHWMNGVDRYDTGDGCLAMAKLSFSPVRPFVFYCGRFDRWKRQDRAVRVLEKARARGLDVELVFAGDDKGAYSGYRKEVEAQANDLGLMEHIRFLGHVTRDETIALHSAAHASLFMYDVCNIGNAMHEAVAAGAAVIVRNDRTIGSYIIDGLNGLIVNGEEEAVDAIGSMVAAPERRAALAASAVTWSAGNMKSWADRCLDELRLIDEAVRGEPDALHRT